VLTLLMLQSKFPGNTAGEMESTTREQKPPPKGWQLRCDTTSAVQLPETAAGSEGVVSAVGVIFDGIFFHDQNTLIAAV
jgi:hypothetical protein